MIKDILLNKKNRIILLIVIVTIIELIYIKPLTPFFYVMNFWGKSFYIIAMYAFPVYIILPIGLIIFIILLPIIKRDYFRVRLNNFTRKTYFVFSVFLLFVISLLVFSKLVLNKDPFPLIPYSSIKGTLNDISDIREGTFKVKDWTLHRDNKKELYISNITNDTIISDLIWISENEYEVTPRLKNKWRKDNSTRVIITSNTPDYYEFYIKFGEYAVYSKGFK